MHDSKCTIKKKNHSEEDHMQNDNEMCNERLKMPHANRRIATRQTTETQDKFITTQSGRISRKPDWLTM